MSQLGTSLVSFKAALISELQERLPNVSYESPVDAEGLVGDDGSGDAIWWGDDADATHDVKVITGGPHWFEEDYTATLIVQSLGRDTDADQETVDTRASNMLGEVIGILASDPGVGIVDTSTVQLFTALPDSWSYASGVLGQSSRRAARFELDIRVNARLKLQAS